MACVINYKNKTYSLEEFKNVLLQEPFLVKEVVNKAQERLKAIQEVFNANPELSKIGDVFSYAIYLDTIFPDSQIKDIVYRADKRTNLDSQTTVDDYTQLNVNGVFYTTELNYTKNYNKTLKGKIYPTLLNIVNPAEIKTKQDIERLGRNKAEFERINKLKYSTNPKDSLIFDNTIYKTKDKYGEVGKEMVVFEPEQIHILSSKADIEGFKEFVQEEKDDLKPFIDESNKVGDESINERLKKYEESIKIPNNVKSKVLEKIEKETEKVKEKLLSLGLKQEGNKFELITNSYATFRMKLKELENVNAIISTNKTSDFYQIIARLKNTDSTMELKKQGELPFTPIEVKQVIQEQQFLNDVADNVFEGLSEEEKQILKKKIENGDYDLNCRI